MYDSEFIQALKNGDNAAFSILIESKKNKVLNLCHKFVRDPRDAEDVAQETFVEVFKSISKFNSGSELSTWIYRIAVNKCLDFLRKKKIKNKVYSFLNVFGLSQKDEIYLSWANENPLNKLLDKEVSIEIFKAIDKLPENQKIAITLTKLQGLSVKNASEIMDVSEQALQSLLQRARNNLKKYLNTSD